MQLNFLVFLILPGCLCVFQDCGSKPGTFVKMSITDCNQQDDKCILRKREQITISITFKNVDTKTVDATACGKLSGTENCVTFPLPQPDGCKSEISCPVTADKKNTYSASFNILSIFPKVSVDVVWRLLDDSGAPFICVVIPATIR